MQIDVQIANSNLPSGGIPNSTNVKTGVYKITFSHRTYTQSEYDYKLERAELYRYLWLAGLPFVLLGIKAFRDILEDK